MSRKRASIPLERDGLQEVEDTEKEVLSAGQRHAGLMNKVKQLPIPVAANKLRMTISPTVLPMSQPLPATTAMLQEENAAVGPADTAHLPESSQWISEGAIPNIAGLKSTAVIWQELG